MNIYLCCTHEAVLTYMILTKSVQVMVVSGQFDLGDLTINVH